MKQLQKILDYQKKKVKEIVKSHTEEKFLGIFGEEKVNVLKCNLDIAAAMGII